MKKEGDSSMYSSKSLMYSATDAAIWSIVAIILAIVGGLVVYFIFLNKKNEGKFNGFVGWLYDFLSFKKMFLEALLKITYLMVAIYLTVSSFGMIGTSFWLFLSTLIIGNLILRVVYEFSLVLLVICRNTTEINKKLSNTTITTNENKENENKEK